jgi:hypothetical protein
MEQQFVPWIELPVKNLPSGGKCYPEGTEISYQGYLFGDLLMINASKGWDVMKRLEEASKGIKSNKVSVEQLTFPDIVYLSMLRRMSSLGSSEFETKYICRKCNKPSSKVFSQMDVSFNDMEFEGETLEVILSDESKMRFSPLTFGDAKRLHNGTASRFKKENLSSDTTAVYAIMCRNMPFDDAYNKIYNISNSDDAEVFNVMNEMFGHDLKPLTSSCNNCGHENKLVLEGRDSLITPFRRGESTTGPRISVIKRTKPKPLSHEADGVQRVETSGS